MKKAKEDEFSKELKKALDAFIKKGIKIYKDYDVDQQNSLIKKAMNEILNDLVRDMKKEDDYNEDEAREIETKLRKFMNEYFQETIKKTGDN